MIIFEECRNYAWEYFCRKLVHKERARVKFPELFDKFSPLLHSYEIRNSYCHFKSCPLQLQPAPFEKIVSAFVYIAGASGKNGGAIKPEAGEVVLV